MVSCGGFDLQSALTEALATRLLRRRGLPFLEVWSWVDSAKSCRWHSSMMAYSTKARSLIFTAPRLIRSSSLSATLSRISNGGVRYQADMYPVNTSFEEPSQDEVSYPSNKHV
ncbi:hypothetical protein JG688_00005410 [Phytophthora aleatoria]|uniref:Uncharacterized protein n=1 Tax=Phytophthora aleatoria TaxID=2496075 RepID=A0A8J5IRZ3_9STRA|nr:hypothetical protein JG688_00005410 [Phytophthora aleatoria]